MVMVQFVGIIFGDIIKMAGDKFGRTPKTSQNVTNVNGVSHEYLTKPN